jgi:hypothetical protein
LGTQISVVHFLLSLQIVVLTVFLQPREAEQVSVVQGLPSSQLIGRWSHLFVRLLQNPTLHLLDAEQKSGISWWIQSPVFVSQVSQLQEIPSLQFFGELVQPLTPQKSSVQGSLSSQINGGLQPKRGSQVVLVQGLLSLGQTTGFRTQCPLVQESVVHRLSSSQSIA